MNAVDAYIKNVAEPQKTELLRVRSIIAAATPNATEVITYGIPGFKYKGKYLIAYAAFKNHMSIFPGGEIVDTLKQELNGFKTSKGTIQFTVKKPMPETLLNKIVSMRISSIDSANK